MCLSLHGVRRRFTQEKRFHLETRPRNLDRRELNGAATFPDANSWQPSWPPFNDVDYFSLMLILDDNENYDEDSMLLASRFVITTFLCCWFCDEFQLCMEHGSAISTFWKSLKMLWQLNVFFLLVDDMNIDDNSVQGQLTTFVFHQRLFER